MSRNWNNRERTTTAWGRRWSCAVVLAMLLLNATRAAGADIALVRSADNEPYAQADAALRKQLEAAHDTVRSMTAREVSEKGLDGTIGPADVVVAIGTPAARWLHKQLPPEAKLVYCMVTNAAEAGLTQGPACWGVSTDMAIGDQFKLIEQALPRARAVGVLYRSNAPESAATLHQLQAALPGGWHVEAVAVNESPSVADAIDTLTQKNLDVIWTTPDPHLYDTAAVRTLLLSALRAKIPVWGFSPAFVRAGALLGVGVEPAAQGSQAADIVLTILGGPPPSSGSVQNPREIQIAVNLIVAEQLSIDVPDDLLRRATFIYRPEK